MLSRNKTIMIAAVLTVLAAGAYAAFPQGGAAARRFADLMPGAGGPDVALHKALYDLNMVSVESGAGIVGIKGTMYFEQGDACDAWTTDQRFTMEYQYPERRPVNNTNHYVAWESKDENRIEFNSERQENGKLTELLRGSAERQPEGRAQAKYTRPDGLTFDLPQGYLLPIAHTNEIIRRARAGEKLFNAVMFDGTDADGPVSITVFIGKKATADEIRAIASGAGGKIDESLLDGDAWHVRMAVFPLKDADGLLPSYEMDMILHANGVVSHALVDYRTFKVEQRLKTIEKLPAPKCP